MPAVVAFWTKNENCNNGQKNEYLRWLLVGDALKWFCQFIQHRCHDSVYSVGSKKNAISISKQGLSELLQLFAYALNLQLLLTFLLTLLRSTYGARLDLSVHVRASAFI